MWPFTRKPAAAVPQPSTMTADVLPQLPVWEQFSRIGGNLTPLRVTDILREADSGAPARLVDLFHECRQKDSHLQSVMGAAESDVTSLDWVVSPPKNATPREDEATEALAAAWGDIDAEAAIAHLVGESMLFGYAYAQVFWRRVGGRVVPVRIDPVSCRRFGFRQSDGALLFDEKGTGSVSRGGVDLMGTYPAKFVEVRRRINGDVLIREGLSRGLVWMALGRNWTFRDWLTLGEIGFKPTVLAKYLKSASKLDIQHLAEVVERFHATGKATIPETVDISVEWPKNSGTSLGGVHRELQSWLADEMSKAVLHGALTVHAGVRGARSLGEVQQGGRDNVRDTNVRVVCEALKRCIAAPFAAMNFGPATRPPTLGLATENQNNVAEFGAGLAAVKKAGLKRIPARWVREQAGIPEAAEGEETLDDDLDIDVVFEPDADEEQEDEDQDGDE